MICPVLFWRCGCLCCDFLENVETGNILSEDSQSNVITSPPLANQVVYYQDDG